MTDYLVGAHLDEALAAGQEIDVYWPFSDGDVSDWIQAEALWYVLDSPHNSTLTGQQETHAFHPSPPSSHPNGITCPPLLLPLSF